MSWTKVDHQVALEVATHEAVVRQAYKNPGDVWTWSVGLTSATGHIVERYIGKPQSLTHCLRVYVWALDNYADAVRKVFEGTELKKHQFAAALSFHWNTGEIESASWVKLFKAGKMAQARKAFMRWNKPSSIIDRRTAEAELLFEGKWSQTGEIAEYTRLHASGAIDWGSRRMRDISKELTDALAGEIPAADKVIVEKTVEVKVPVPIEKPVVPEKVEKKVKNQTNFWTVLTAIISSGGLGALGFAGMEWQALLALGGVAAIFLLIFLLFGYRMAGIIKALREETE